MFDKNGISVEFNHVLGETIDFWTLLFRSIDTEMKAWAVQWDVMFFFKLQKVSSCMLLQGT